MAGRANRSGLRAAPGWLAVGLLAASTAQAQNWRVGREREARFQWDQALTLKPTPEDEAKIKKKLETGLAAFQSPQEVSKQAARSTEPDPK